MSPRKTGHQDEITYFSFPKLILLSIIFLWEIYDVWHVVLLTWGNADSLFRSFSGVKNYFFPSKSFLLFFPCSLPSFLSSFLYWELNSTLYMQGKHSTMSHSFGKKLSLGQWFFVVFTRIFKDFLKICICARCSGAHLKSQYFDEWGRFPWVWNHSGAHSKFKASLNYSARLCLRKATQKTHTVYLSSQT